MRTVDNAGTDLTKKEPTCCIVIVCCADKILDLSEKLPKNADRQSVACFCYFYLITYQLMVQGMVAL
jgi:hypothetical protein